MPKRAAGKKLRGILDFKKEPALLDSFYKDDLNKVLNTVNDDEMLLAYIKGRKQKHVDIDKNWSFIAELLAPDSLPDGRWPSNVEFYQSLMQQVAINVIRDKATDKSDLRTVNGPPGTGKTTLLKDVFADMVVEQAKAMAKLTFPYHGYRKLGRLNWAKQKILLLMS